MGTYLNACCTGVIIRLYAIISLFELSHKYDNFTASCSCYAIFVNSQVNKLLTWTFFHNQIVSLVAINEVMIDKLHPTHHVPVNYNQVWLISWLISCKHAIMYWDRTKSRATDASRSMILTHYHIIFQSYFGYIMMQILLRFWYPLACYIMWNRP